MCLDSIQRSLKATSTVKYGWKVFNKGPMGALEFEYNSLRDTWTVPRGKWLKAVRHKMGVYTTGFHVFTQRKDAVNWSYLFRQAIVKVKIKGVRIEGRQRHGKVLVADYMLVPLTKKRKKVVKK
jgi:hypothetical protein